MHRLARGEDVRVVDADRDARSYGEEGTFGTDVRDDRTVREAIIAHGEAVARRLRHDRVLARTVVLKIKLAERLGAGKYRLLTRQAPLAVPSDDGDAITAVALRLWERNRPRRAVRLIGVSARGIDGTGDPQLTLFEDARRATRSRLNAALDRIVARFGTESIGRAVGKPEKASPTLHLKRGEPDRP
jgi:DNA polymerase-4